MTVEVGAARVYLSRVTAQIVELDLQQNVYCKSNFLRAKQTSEVASATIRSLEEKFSASVLRCREFDAQKEWIEQVCAGFRCALVQERMDDEQRRMAEIAMQQQKRSVHKAEIGRIREEFVSVRAQDRAVAVL